MDSGARPAGAADGGAPSSAAGPAAAGRVRPAFRYALKDWRVRSRLLLLVVLPTLAAVILGGVSVVSSARSALAYQRVEQFSRLGGQITNLVQALQVEREDTIRYITMGSGGHGRGAPSPAAAPEVAVLTRDHRVTDRLAARVRSGTGTIGSSYPLVAQQEAKGAVTAIAGLQALRSAATSTHIPALVVIQEYASTISRLLALEGEIATGSKDAALADTVRVVGLISASTEQTSQEQAILTSALTSDLVGATKFQPSQLTAIGAAQAEQQADLAQFGLIATSSQRHRYDSALSSAQATHAQAQVQQAITLALDGGSSAENPAFTNAASGSAYLVASLHQVEQGFVGSIIGRSAALRTRSITAALIEGLAVMLVLALALLFTTAVGRSMTRPLRRLRTGALEVAGVRLPQTVRLMTEDGGLGQPLDIEPIDVDSADEIGEVARAFDQVHREAVRLAANEAALRGNINAIFVNLSRRSQSLVERQIRLIDDLEQGEQDSERLANLFQMDHLATRMRRNSENLLVLAGHDLSRRWTEPVALVDVLRAAVSEIEHYERVTPHIQPGISVRGPAVSDVVHLLSELVENATVFSPEESLVRVSGYALNSGGALLDITDQGVGMDSEDVAHVNWRLDNPPVVDVAASRRMGLFVVARLAARHGIRVRLRPAPGGGLTALVWLPDEVITRETIASTLSLRRFHPATKGAAVSWMEIGLAVTDPDAQAAAAQAVSAARTPHPEPATPDTGDVAAEITDRPEDSALPAVPSASEQVATPLDAGPAAGSGGAAAPDNWVIVPPAGSADTESRLPIFESVESDWFRGGKRSADRSALAPEASPVSWSSPADAGWRAAKVTQAPVSAGSTGAGLPKRVPNANLVPGRVTPLAVLPASEPARSATQTRQRLTSFQQGIRKARAAGTQGEPHASKEDL